VATAIVAVGCGAPILGCGDEGAMTGKAQTQATVLADTTFLADITRNVAGERLSVASLLPMGADPHSFEPTPRDARKVADSRVVVINSYGLEPQVDELIASAGSPALLVVEAAAGLPGRTPQQGEAAFAGGDEGVENGGEMAEIDPHFWLDPVSVVAYVDNIRRGLSSIDPEGADVYEAQAESYARRLRELDAWIRAEVEKIPAERRLLVTNHESFGYFADRYGFQIVGTLFSTAGAEGSPSAQDMAGLVEEIRATGAPAIFVETGSSDDLATQIAREAGVDVVTDLYTHSLGENVSTYLDMMRWNVSRIVEALRVDGR
jgi:ABC-type Zn uptake system ZnuABC Zn-binding protein ZnuA